MYLQFKFLSFKHTRNIQPHNTREPSFSVCSSNNLNPKNYKIKNFYLRNS